MRKLYTDMHLVVGKSSEEFMKKLSDAIDEYQTKKFHVEVQYQASYSSLSALVLAYKEELV